MSKLRSHEMFPWADWITKHLIDNYGSLRGVGPTRVKEMDLLQMKENLRYSIPTQWFPFFFSFFFSRLPKVVKFLRFCFVKAPVVSRVLAATARLRCYCLLFVRGVWVTHSR